jgi:hypothetical protein
MHPLSAAYEMGYRAGADDQGQCPFPKGSREWKTRHEAQRHGANVRANALAFARWHEANERDRANRRQP